MASYILSLGILFAAPASEVWPAFRGTGDSISTATDLPLRWSAQENIAWTTTLEGYGQSSPVIWRDRVFATVAIGEEKRRVAVSCLSLLTGKVTWTKSLQSSQPEKINGYISVAAPTPAVDGNRIYAFFETGDLIALDHNGNMEWKRSLTKEIGPFRGNHGLGSSLAAADDRVFVLVCHDGPSYLLAVDKATGKTLWKADRPQQVSWTSPIIARNDKSSTVIVSSAGVCDAFDATTGKLIWQIDGLEGNTVPSATVSDEQIIIGSSQIGSNVAIRRDGRGNVTDSHINWRNKDATATFSSPIAYRGFVYMVNRTGVAFCLDLKSGETVWTHRIGESCWASPFGAEGHVYFFGKSGTTTVVAAGPKLEVLAENALITEDRVYGVAAVSGALRRPDRQ